MRFDEDVDVTVASVFMNFGGSKGCGFVRPVRIDEYEGMEILGA